MAQGHSNVCRSSRRMGLTYKAPKNIGGLEGVEEALPAVPLTDARRALVLQVGIEQNHLCGEQRGASRIS
jgi:hypothetical protein